nr:MAG TPA: hypothetical protein [Bacteriophage sp.]
MICYQVLLLPHLSLLNGLLVICQQVWYSIVISYSMCMAVKLQLHH